MPMMEKRVFITDEMDVKVQECMRNNNVTAESEALRQLIWAGLGKSAAPPPRPIEAQQP